MSDDDDFIAQYERLSEEFFRDHVRRYLPADTPEEMIEYAGERIQGLVAGSRFKHHVLSPLLGTGAVDALEVAATSIEDWEEDADPGSPAVIQIGVEEYNGAEYPIYGVYVLQSVVRPVDAVKRIAEQGLPSPSEVFRSAPGGPERITTDGSLDDQIRQLLDQGD